MEIRAPEPRDVGALMELAADVIGPERAGPFIRSHLEGHHVLIADRDDEVVGFLAYRTDWFQCTFVSLVSVKKDDRRKGVARALYRKVEADERQIINVCQAPGFNAQKLKDLYTKIRPGTY